MSATHYEILEVSPSASPEAIVAAYKRLHSRLAARISGVAGADGDTLDRMDELREAFAVLSDPERRRTYDSQLNSRPGRGAVSARPVFPALAILGLAVMAGLGLARLDLDRQERERVAAEARMADLLLQREREAKRAAAAAAADLERRRNEAAERFNREHALKGPHIEASQPGSPQG